MDCPYSKALQTMNSGLLSGTVTFLFTDIEGSTKLWERHPEAIKGALARHDEILKSAIQANQGFLVKTTGDGCHAVLARAESGILAVRDAQRAIHAEP